MKQLTAYIKDAMVSILQRQRRGFRVFEHLLVDDPKDFNPVDKIAPLDLLDAQVGTAEWLSSFGIPSAEELTEKVCTTTAREAFLALTTHQTPAEQRKNLLLNTTPQAVKQTVAMLTAYDWAFVECARELRGYTVAKIIEDTQNPDARHRLRALEMLGKVTEVALFTERVEHTKIDLTDEALEAKIKQRLDKFRHVIDVNEVIDQPSIVAPEERIENDERAA